MHEDHLSGASEMLPAAAEAVLGAVERVGSTPAALAPALRLLIAEQPAMGAVHRLASRALEVARAAEANGLDAAAARREIGDSLEAFAADFEAASQQIVELAVHELLPDDGYVATTSRSSLVERTLLAGRRAGRRCGALIAESRPLHEGRTLATRLAEAGLPVLFASDAALVGLLGGAAAILVGADAVRPKSFLNKVGTTALLLGGREFGLPAHGLAQTAKFLPAEAALLDLVVRPPEQIWQTPASGVRVLNPTFEEVDLRLVHGLATERGVLPPGEAGAVARDVQIAPEFASAARNGGAS